MSNSRKRGWAWLFLIPFAALLFPMLYAHQNPVIAGFPMFYWYLIVWIVLTGIISAIVYALTGPYTDED